MFAMLYFSYLTEDFMESHRMQLKYFGIFVHLTLAFIGFYIIYKGPFKEVLKIETEYNDYLRDVEG